MTIQAGRISALTSAAALMVTLACGLAGTSPAHATAGTAARGTILMAADVPAESDAAALAASDSTTIPADRSIGPGSTISDTRVATTAVPEATAANPVLLTSTDEGGWDKASLIGKIFIACGTLLTLGSAARMFMI